MRRGVTLRIVGLSAAAIAATGCPGADDTAEPDAATASGLIVTWSTTTALPGPIGDDVRLAELELRFSSLRVIGDAAASGDPRTTRGTTTLPWQAGGSPDDVELPTAPPGLYALLELGVGGDDERVELAGEALVGGTWYPFEIEDERQHAVSSALALALAPGTRATIPVAVDLAVLVGSLAFDQMAIEEGQLIADDGDVDALWGALDGAVTASPITATARVPR